MTCSGFITSITILLIVVFLFAEALGLFNKKVIEEGYVLAVNKAQRHIRGGMATKRKYEAQKK